MKTELPKIETLPQPPTDSTFSLVKVENVSFPHPYCITPKHVAYAADHCGGILSSEAIERAERSGACCDICRKQGGNVLKFSEHQTQATLFIRVPQNRDLNAVEGLHAYLFENKSRFFELGIQGFAFPV